MLLEPDEVQVIIAKANAGAFIKYTQSEVRNNSMHSDQRKLNRRGITISLHYVIIRYYNVTLSLQCLMQASEKRVFVIRKDQGQVSKR